MEDARQLLEARAAQHAADPICAHSALSPLQGPSGLEPAPLRPSQDTERIPVPKLLECDQGTSQSRFVLAKLNPSMTHMNSAFTKPGEVIFTEDISIEKFMEGLSRLAVNAK